MQHGVRFQWLLRRMYWFLSFDRGYWDAARARPARRFHRLLYFAGLSLANGPRTSRIVLRAWHMARLMQCPGRTPADETAFHHGWLDNEQIRTLRTKTDQVYGEVDRLEARTIHMRDGQRIDCDLLVCATGCNPIAAPIALNAGGAPVRYDDVELVYRFSVIPELPQLIFTGYCMFGFGPLNGYHRAAWILRYIEQNLTTEQLRTRARADGDPPYLFRRGSFLFDGSTNLLATVKTMNRRMGEGIYDYADLKRHYRDTAVNHIYAPLGGVERFLAARRRRDA